MWGDGYNSNLIFVGAVTPEYTIGSRRSVLSVSFKNLLIRIIWVLERTILMRIEARMARVALKKFNTFINLLKEPFHWRGFGFFVLFTVIQRVLCRIFEFFIFLLRDWEPNKIKHLKLLVCEFVFPRLLLGKRGVFYKLAFTRLF